MSREFLAQLLRSENRVIADPSQICHICLQECGSISSEIGVIECPIRLPCSHVLGSVCIATWLKTENTCPTCRREFFPAQPRLHGPEDSDDEDDGDEGEEIDDETGNRLVDICDELELRLHLSFHLHGIIADMASNILLKIPREGHSLRCAAVLSLHILSHIFEDPKSLYDLSLVSDVRVPDSRALYRTLYPDRESLVPARLPTELIKVSDDISGLLGLLPAPTVENGFSEETLVVDSTEDVNMRDTNDEQVRSEVPEDPRLTPEDICRNLCIELRLGESAINICHALAERVQEEQRC